MSPPAHESDFEVEDGGFDGGDAHDLKHVEGEESDEVGFDFVDGLVVEMGVVGFLFLGVDGEGCSSGSRGPCLPPCLPAGLEGPRDSSR